MATLGQTIGILTDTFNITNDAGDKLQMSVKYDVRQASDATIKAWLCADRRITTQGKLRKKTLTELKAMQGQTFIYDGSRTAVQVDGKSALIAEAIKSGVDPMDADALMKWVNDYVAKNFGVTE